MAAEIERWLTVEEVADYLKLSRAKIYEMAQRSEIPCTKIAGQWRFKRAEVDEWMIGKRQGVAALGARR